MGKVLKKGGGISGDPFSLQPGRGLVRCRGQGWTKVERERDRYGEGGGGCI